MTIDSYSALKSEIASFLNRDDLTSAIPTWIQMAEARFNDEVRHWRMETKTTFTADAQFEDLPADWVDTVRMTVQSGQRLVLLPFADMAEKRERNQDATGQPYYCALFGGQVELFPTPDGSYTVDHLYRAKIAALSDANTTNWLLTAAPDAYLYASLVHSAPYLVEDQRIAVWAGLAQEAINRVNRASDAARHSGSGMRIAVR